MATEEPREPDGQGRSTRKDAGRAVTSRRSPSAARAARDLDDRQDRFESPRKPMGPPLRTTEPDAALEARDVADVPATDPGPAPRSTPRPRSGGKG